MIALRLLPALLLLLPLSATANGVVPFETTAIGNYLIVGMGPVNEGSATIGTGDQPGVGDASDTSNFELGAIKARVPATDSELNDGGGPTLEGAVPAIPSNVLPVQQGITGDGNIAITHTDGSFKLQNVGVYADDGIHCAGSGCDSGTQNSFINDPNQFPNTFDTTTQTGELVYANPGDGTPSADQTLGLPMQGRIDQPNGAGVTENYDFTTLNNELAAVKTVIPGLAQTSGIQIDGIAVGADVWDLSMDGGQVQSDTVIIELAVGLNVIDIETDGNDFKLDNSTLIIDGSEDSFAIFRVGDAENFLVANSNILVGDGGIGLNNVLFFSDRPDNATHFSFNNTIINGAAFWTVGMEGGGISIQNGQGCTQLIADWISLSDVRLSRCAFGGGSPPIPEPSSALIFAVGALLMRGATRRRRTA